MRQAWVQIIGITRKTTLVVQHSKSSSLLPNRYSRGMGERLLMRNEGSITRGQGGFSLQPAPFLLRVRYSFAWKVRCRPCDHGHSSLYVECMLSRGTGNQEWTIINSAHHYYSSLVSTEPKTLIQDIVDRYSEAFYALWFMNSWSIFGSFLCRKDSQSWIGHEKRKYLEAADGGKHRRPPSKQDIICNPVSLKWVNCEYCI